MSPRSLVFAVFLLLFRYFSMMNCEIDCKLYRKRAALCKKKSLEIYPTTLYISCQDLSIRCCLLTRPSLDKGNAECRKSLNLPTHRKFNFAELYTINMCIEECNYITSGYIEIDPPYRLDLANIRINLKSIAPQPQEKSIAFLLDAYRKCEVFRSSHGGRFTLHLPDVEFIEEPCNPFSLQITICLRIHAMQKCPRQFYVDSQECRLAREYFTQCVGDIEANLV